LLILGSCGGERKKLSIGNFTNLMVHMGIKLKEKEASEFDSGRDSSDS